VRRLLLLLVLVTAAAAVVPGGAGATNECRGLQICVPVDGPWVVVPTGKGEHRPQVEFQLSCPRGFIVGGLDAELTSRAIDVAFRGLIGSPVTPGVTTGRAVVFLGTFTGAGRSAQSFRPHIGCIPTSGGGRIPTAAAVFPPGAPTVRRVLTLDVEPGTRLVARGCLANERLVGGSHAIGFFTPTPPDGWLTASIATSQDVRAGRIVVSVHAARALTGSPAVLQVSAICGGGA
jgi:hypothetical protein